MEFIYSAVIASSRIFLGLEQPSPVFLDGRFFIYSIYLQ